MMLRYLLSMLCVPTFIIISECIWVKSLVSQSTADVTYTNICRILAKTDFWDFILHCIWGCFKATYFLMLTFECKLWVFNICVSSFLPNACERVWTQLILFHHHKNGIFSSPGRMQVHTDSTFLKFHYFKFRFHSPSHIDWNLQWKARSLEVPTISVLPYLCLWHVRHGMFIYYLVYYYYMHMSDTMMVLCNDEKYMVLSLW